MNQECYMCERRVSPNAMRRNKIPELPWSYSQTILHPFVACRTCKEEQYMNDGFTKERTGLKKLIQCEG